MRARVLPGIVVAAGVLASAWSLAPLFLEAGWVPAALILVATVLLTGVLAREWFGARGWVPVVQLVTLVVVTGWMFDLPPSGRAQQAGEDPSTLLFGLPTPATVDGWGDLVAEAAGVLSSNPAPAPTTPGVVFLLAVSIGLLALAADTIAVTLAMPALAGLPILAPYLTAVANSNGALPWRYFVAPSVAWLVLLALADQGVRRRWRGLPATPRRTTTGARTGEGGGRDAGLPTRGIRRGIDPGVETSRWAAALGAGGAALVLALVAAQVLPQLPVRYLAEGLGRGGVGGSGVVGFSTNLDLRTSLRATDQSPVLRYRTDDPNPGPLRVLVAERFTGQGWVQRRATARPTQGPQMPSTGYEGLVTTSRQTLTVEETGLDAPHVAAPYGIVDGSMTDARWAVDERTGVTVVDRTPASYRLEYLVPLPSEEQLASATARAPWRPGSERRGTLRLDDQDALVLEEAMRGVVPQDATPYRAAVAIQDWLRSSAFTYSLDGVPEPSPESGPESSAQPPQASLLARFLREKRGYCTHFATAMVLAARAHGIPARMAYGFLPGMRIADGYEVRQSDAHAWPELHFPQIGWLRFEPTPVQRSGSAPAYAAEYGPAAGPSTAPGSASAAPAQPLDDLDDASFEEDRDPALDPGGEPAASPGPGWWWALPALLGAATAMLVMPVVARLARRRDVARAADDAERAEVEWAYLTSALADLGFVPPASRTLGEQQAYYAHAAVLDGREQRALRTVADTVERARYAPPGTPLPDVGAEADVVRRAAGALRSWRRRARAWLWPGYAVSALRRAAGFGRRGRPASAPVRPEGVLVVAAAPSSQPWEPRVPVSAATGDRGDQPDPYRPPPPPAPAGR